MLGTPYVLSARAADAPAGPLPTIRTSVSTTVCTGNAPDGGNWRHQTPTIMVGCRGARVSHYETEVFTGAACFSDCRVREIRRGYGTAAFAGPVPTRRRGARGSRWP